MNMKHQPKIGIIDYGVGNLHSVNKAFRQFTGNIVLIEDASDIKSCNAIVLPGVGSFQSGMEGLKIRGMAEEVIAFSKTGKPMLGICLGAQLMLSRGFEFGETVGLNLIAGDVRIFPNCRENFKIPHIGWNGIYCPGEDSWLNTILNGSGNKEYFYFVHSFVLMPENKENILALCNYDGYEFCAAVKKGNIYGCQFHPEKSGPTGLKIIKEFINLI